METKQRDLWECPRCKNSSLDEDECCPCPRGSCEAEITGLVITTVKIIRYDKEETKEADS